MYFGLTLKELLEITQSDQPDVLKVGEIARVLQILEEQYENKQLDNLQKLEGLEQKRTLRLEAESGQFLERKCKPTTRKYVKPENQSQQWSRATSQQQHKQQHQHQHHQLAKNSQLLFEVKMKEHDTGMRSWMDKQKPGLHSPPEIDHLKNSRQHQLERNNNSANPAGQSADDSATQNSEDINPDACLHLPLWMVRCATPLMRQFLEAQQCGQLFTLGNSLVLCNTKM
ncbi:hypothetical protein FGIG_05870 [Fasciola gigantica]|uniref:Uncharacterized protein n=1 Tax=Fasciola gigantica TaxID=46835 RepID=A0A504Z422_FASGI|nr:hypothetical protein FGIG_05870 [Fasciola gigantica]